MTFLEPSCHYPWAQLAQDRNQRFLLVIGGKERALASKMRQRLHGEVVKIAFFHVFFVLTIFLPCFKTKRKTRNEWFCIFGQKHTNLILIFGWWLGTEVWWGWCWLLSDWMHRVYIFVLFWHLNRCFGWNLTKLRTNHKPVKHRSQTPGTVLFPVCLSPLYFLWACPHTQSYVHQIKIISSGFFEITKKANETISHPAIGLRFAN